MTKCRHCGSVTSYFVFDVCERCQADGKDSRVSARKVDRAQTIVPLLESGRVFLTGTPWGDKANIAPLTPESREYIDVMEYTARWWHPHKPVVYGVDCGMPIYDFPCSCGRTIRGTDRDRGKRCIHVKRVEVPIRDGKPETLAAEMPHIKERLMFHTGIPSHMLITGPIVVNEPWSFAWNGITYEMVVTAPPSPPTLREWLGDRVSELGRWAEVLREQPVPAGCIGAWEWRGMRLYGLAFGTWTEMTAPNLFAVIGPDRAGFYPMGEAIQMALFTRHPDVKPEPKPAAFPWDPYPEVA